VRKTIFTFSFPVTLTALTFRPQIFSPGYSCPALCFHKIKVSIAFRCRKKSEARDERTDRQTDGRG